MKLPHENEQFRAEFEGGFLFILDKCSNDESMTRLNNARGQNITIGQFKDSCHTHGFDRACVVFRKLRATL